MNICCTWKILYDVVTLDNRYTYERENVRARIFESKQKRKDILFDMKEEERH